VKRLVDQADIVVSCAPLFEERLALNAEAVRQGKPFVDCAMHELSGQVSATAPGFACLACRVPIVPPDWKRQFPVVGAVSGVVGCVGAMEVIKIAADIGEPLYNRVLAFDLRDMRFRVVNTRPNPQCPVCVKR
jgi:molybdopterin/thiamine biosynthesis adenylyltransferase